MAHCDSGQLPVQTADSDSDSDTERLPPRQQVIHSGHFMVSSPHGDDRHRGNEPELSGTHPAGSIDPTLTRLFECMSLAYSGKLVSPKWKNFKGLRLLWRDKIRLNNAIWRAWYLQYVEKRKTSVCGFVTPLDGLEGDDHRKPEAVVLEGNYWKRRIEVVMKEYHKWRIYYKKRLRKHQQGDKPFQEQMGASSCRCNDLYAGCSLLEDACRTDEEMLYDLDYFLSDISDTLFTMTHGHPTHHTYPDYDYAGNADMIQPELSTLQPNLDDFMDISDFFSGPRPVTSQQMHPCSQEHNFANFGPETVPQTSPVVNNHRIPQSPSCFGSQSESCFSSSTLSKGFERTTVPCVSSCAEPKHLPQYPTANDGFTTDSFPQPPTLPIQRICPNLPLQEQDLFFPRVSCPKSSFACVATDTNTISQAALPSIHADVYPLFSEPPTHVEPPPIFPVPKPRGRVESIKHKRLAPGGTKKAMSILNQSHFSAKLDSASHLPSCEPAGPNNTTITDIEGRSEPISFTSITAPAPNSPVPPSTFCALGFSPPPIFLSQVFCAQGSSTGVGTSACPPLLPKTERLSPTSLCGNDRKDSLHVPCILTSSSWRGSEHKKVESRRITHISAEQKRRCNIKIGFDTLQNLVTSLHSQHSNKLSKATTLQKTADYIYKLQQERAQLQEEAQRLRCQIQELNDSINLCQQQLPASGVPITRQRFQHMRQMFKNYVQTRTLQNWKFWLFSIIIRPLFESFNGMVSTSSMTDLRETSLDWLDQHCSLPALRPTVLSSLCQLSTSTSILTDPTLMPEQAVQAVTRAENEDNFF
ncbi:carbohydrate-responsive element-binding protein [Bombina bombina]|uniref:carbohydrate-responsive element-binding protein n=1 Tax=Bombina bombina TaxID=8345 RepID=UPI00235B2A4E|nr:carbohydrate-responsive element-binding protein [Bombina bombina]